MTNTALIDRLIPLADAHSAADEYVAGHYDWRNGACAIGCTIRDATELGLLDAGPGDHRALARLAGAPEWSWRLLDTLFERCTSDMRRGLTPRWLRAVRGVRDWRVALAQAMRVIVREARSHVGADGVDALTAIDGVLELLDRAAAGDEPTGEEWGDARSMAWGVEADAAGAAAWASAWASAAAIAADAAAAAAAAARAAATVEAADRMAEGILSEWEGGR